MDMQNGILLTNQEKWDLVKKLLIEVKTYREIQSIVHVSPNFITKVKIAEFGENSVERENLNKNKLSKRTQAINLFYKGKTTQEVLLELDISVDEIKKAKQDSFQLLDLDNLSQIVRDNDCNLLKEFNNLFIIFQELEINSIEKVLEIKELVEAYPNLNFEITNLNKDIYNLKREKQDLEQVLTDIEYKISLANAVNNEIEDQIKNKKIIIENLECLIDRWQSSEAYNNLKKMIEPIIKDEYWYKTSVLPLIIISVFEIIRNDPRGKDMILDYYNNNPESIHTNNNKNIKNKNNKKKDIKDMINYIFDNYLPIIIDINEYSQKLHNNLWEIYPPYLFSKILQMSHFDNLSKFPNDQYDCDSNNNNNQFSINFGPGLNNSNSCTYIE
ncbi:MAG: hypothetical protein ACR2F1_03290 [Nitrososphaeraceae archaeon]